MPNSIKTIAKIGCLAPLFWCRIALAQGVEETIAAPENAALPGEEDPSRAPAAGKGVVWGVVTDAKTKEPVIDAQVTVVGTKIKAIADFDGRYRLELSPGTYELRVFYQLYKTQRLQNVRITAGKVDQVDVALPAEETQQEIVVEVEADPDRASAAAQTLIRKNAAAVGDAVSAQEIAKTPRPERGGRGAARGRRDRRRAAICIRPRSRRAIYERAPQRDAAPEPGARQAGGPFRFISHERAQRPDHYKDIHPRHAGRFHGRIGAGHDAGAA
ncbi:MAG: carboxypeptidase-like regulatory domain-containing protein [Polyangiaceae bacterium]|nr:carboxypeptidase-like regulatory domain-containing protein [Polyangiaceae bacterium]